MKWPNPTDYQDAVQNPRLCFSDPELQSGVMATTALGLPRVASGNFASVYEMQAGKKRWAVRCFLRQCADQQKHYAHITNHLKSLWLPFLVDFEYQPQGIRIFGQPYPIVKMQWVDGVALHTFVKKKLKRPQDLMKLAAQWRGMVNSLHGNLLAHGDLQHGNVLVTPTGIARLVDYDAMYVPALYGTKCAELGHANYQHPQRQANHYDHNLDNFAALVIYVSLRALAVEPELWDKYNTGENLIFSSSDFKAPAQSALFSQLWRSPDAEVRALSVQLAAWCCGPIEHIGNFEALLSTPRPAATSMNIPAQFAISPILQPIAPTSQPTQVDRWWVDNTAQPQSTAASVTPFAVPKQVVTPVSQIPGSGQVSINPIDGAEMIWIPEGFFLMGASTGKPDEQPCRQIWLNGFYIYKYPVTVMQYKEFCSHTGHPMPIPPLWKWKDNHPIINVSWADAHKYAQWSQGRLPTEGEWEKAARGVDGRVFPWGNDWDTHRCAYGKSMSILGGTSEVDKFIQGMSPFGALDMAGNVWEWCADWYASGYYSVAPSRNPRGPTSGSQRVVRGGCWRSDKEQLYTAHRYCVMPETKSNLIGFRCAAL